MNGPEMMMNAMLKAMGFDPRVFIAQINSFIVSVQEKMVMFTTSAMSINERVENLQVENAKLHAKLDFLISLNTGKVINHGETRHSNGSIIFVRDNGDDVTERSNPHEGSGG